MFGLQSVVNLAKASLKIVLIGGVSAYLVWPEMQALPTMMTLPLDAVAERILEMALLLAMGVIAALTALAIFDMIYQKWDFHQNQKMSRQEIKDENKQSEGDPQVKARIRQIRMERARKRMGNLCAWRSSTLRCLTQTSKHRYEFQNLFSADATRAQC